MLTAKRFTGDFSLESIDSGIVYLSAVGDEVIVRGDLTVQGTTTTVDSDDLAVTDNKITLNNGETGSGVTHPSGFAGILIDRGTATDSCIVWDETNDAWVLDNGDGAGAVNEIATTPIGGTFLTNVVEDTTPQLGGDLDVNLNGIIATSNNNLPLTVSGSGNIVLTTAATGEIQAAGPLLLQGAAPNVTPDSAEVALFKGADTGGGTEVHFENNTDTGELISKKKAFLFSIIF